MVYCASDNCSTKQGKGISLFRFPKNLQQRHYWTTFCKSKNWAPTNASRLCERHFEVSQIQTNADGIRTLKLNAVPTILTSAIPGNISARFESVPSTSNSTAMIERHFEVSQIKTNAVGINTLKAAPITLSNSGNVSAPFESVPSTSNSDDSEQVNPSQLADFQRHFEDYVRNTQNRAVPSTSNSTAMIERHFEVSQIKTNAVGINTLKAAPITSSNSGNVSARFESVPSTSNSDDSEEVNPSQLADFQRHFEDYVRNTQNRELLQDLPEDTLGFMDVKCKHCGALHFAAEVRGGRREEFNDCCNFGNVKLPDLQLYPIQLEHLLNGTDSRSNNFRKYIRNYNSSLAMASMGANIVAPRGNGPYCFKIHGQIYHTVGPLYPDVGNKPAYWQIYILDSEMATTERLSNSTNSGCIASIMCQLGDILSNINPYVASLRMMKEVIEEEERLALLESRSTPSVRMFFDVSKTMDQRRYNAPTAANEIAAVFVGEDGEVPLTRSFTVFARGGGLRQVSYLDKSCDPLTYPLLFPGGDFGWHLDLCKQGFLRKRTGVTQKEYYSYRLAVRERFSAIHHSGKLFQQYVVDSYVKLEQNRLNYERTHQKQLRADTYQTLMEYIGNAAANQNAKVGRRVILPSSYAGGPRAMQQGYQDAMAIVAKYGKPNIFLTFTCNPMWSEIQTQLVPNETASDRPDIVARVFKLKLDRLKQKILHNHLLGRVLAYVCVTEFQKRGLPHCHMLLILAGDDKLRTAEDVDRIVTAEIPNPFEDKRLFEIVKKCMVHGPCGTLNPASPCMQDGVCTKGYPKSVCEETKIEVDGYPQYKRHANGNTLQIKDHIIDNRWIVPYNRYLSLKYNAHINVEVCSSVKSVKYLYKYVYKGHDRAALKLKQTSEEGGGISSEIHYDEITAHLDARYVSAPKASWRIFGFDMQNRSHTIYRLAVHLPNHQNICFVEGNVQDAVDRAHSKNSTLTAWFKLNKLCEEIFQNGYQPEDNMIDSRTLYYREIPEHFVFNKATTTWNRRKRFAKEIGRMYTVGPQDVERYHMRLLLLHVKGATSFDDLKTINGQVYDTFLEAAKEAGLLLDDREYARCLAEVVNFQLPSQLRNVFATLLLFCNVSNALQLWQEFKAALSEDFRRSLSIEESEATAYYAIDDSMKVCGRKLSDFIPLPQIQPHIAVVDNSQNHQAEGESMYRTLNPIQKAACDKIVHLLEHSSRSAKCIFIDGPGGSGKTYLYTTINHICKGRGVAVLNVAWSGIAATLLLDRRTVHNRFKLPVPINKTSFLSTMKMNIPAASILQSSTVIIWDEAPMAPKYALEAVNILLKDIMGNNEVFGGKLMILGGDFRQVLPVVHRGTRSDCIDACLKKSSLWAHFKVIKLITNMRAVGEDMWSTLLLDIGDGKIQSDKDEKIPIPQQCISTGNLIEDLYGKEILPDNADSLCDKVILTPKNIDSLDINNKVLKLLTGEEQIYMSIDEAECEESEVIQFPTEFLHSLTPSGMPPHELRLKIGAIVMLLRNLDIKKGLCNGTKLIVQHMGRYILGCSVACGANKGKYVLIPRITLCPSDTNLPFVLKRKQFPIRLSFAMTINKSQGQTFTKVGLYLNTPVFSHGQLYVAFSRVKTINGLKVAMKGGERHTKNIVYKEIL